MRPIRDILLDFHAHISASEVVPQRHLNCLLELVEVDYGAAAAFGIGLCIDQDILLPVDLFKEIQDFCESSYYLDEDILEFEVHQLALRAAA